MDLTELIYFKAHRLRFTNDRYRTLVQSAQPSSDHINLNLNRIKGWERRSHSDRNVIGMRWRCPENTMGMRSAFPPRSHPLRLVWTKNTSTLDIKEKGIWSSRQIRVIITCFSNTLLNTTHHPKIRNKHTKTTLMETVSQSSRLFDHLHVSGIATIFMPNSRIVRENTFRASAKISQVVNPVQIIWDKSTLKLLHHQ